MELLNDIITMLEYNFSNRRIVVAAVFFIFIISNPVIEKLDRIKLNYGLIEP